jgi:hypothetical protein
MAAKPKIRMKKGENKTVRLTIQDLDGAAIDCTGASYFFGVKQALDDTTYVFSKDSAESGDFDTSQEASGLVDITIDENDSNRTGRFIAELKISFGGGEIDKSTIIDLQFDDAVT